MTSINKYGIPSCLRIPSHTQLEELVGQLQHQEKSALEGAVYQVAQTAGDPIDDSDFQWGKNHLWEREDRLVAALLERLKCHLQAETQCVPAIADRVVRHCPFEEQIFLDTTAFNDLAARVHYLTQLEHYKEGLNGQYPRLNLCKQESDDLRSSRWRALETLLLTLPACSTVADQAKRFEYFFSVIDELSKGNYDASSAEMFLDQLLERVALRPSIEHLHHHLQLKGIEKIVQRQLQENQLYKNRIQESTPKDLFVVPSQSDRQGKVKIIKNGIGTAPREVFGYQIDCLLGTKMTAPTAIYAPQRLSEQIEKIRELFKAAQTARRFNNCELAEIKLKRAYQLFHSEHLPLEVRYLIFEAMYYLCENARSHDQQLGEKLFLDLKGYRTTEQQKVAAIDKYHSSDAFTIHQEKYDTQSLSEHIEELRALFMTAHTARCSNNLELAESSLKQAYQLFECEHVPLEARYLIFEAMYCLCATDQQLGEKLFLDLHGYRTSEHQKMTALDRYLKSDAFRNHQEKYDRNGSLQLWRNDCATATSSLYEFEGGQKLRDVPKTLVHAYTLLDFVKGSQDSHTENTLVILDEKKEHIHNFLAIDDELAATPSHDYKMLRIWQLGLPQCQDPFDRAFCLLYSDPLIVGKIKRLLSFINISSDEDSYQLNAKRIELQIQRVEKIAELFRAELQKPAIELTPRDLFFTLFGGREEYENTHLEGFENTPLYKFDFHLPKRTREFWIPYNESLRETIEVNLRELYRTDAL